MSIESGLQHDYQENRFSRFSLYPTQLAKAAKNVISHKHTSSYRSSFSLFTTEADEIPSIRKQITNSLDNPIIHKCILALVTVDMIMTMTCILIDDLSTKGIFLSTKDLKHVSILMMTFSLIFSGIFTVEVLLRVIMSGLNFFGQPLTIFDTLIVLISTASQIYFLIKNDFVLLMISSSLLMLRWIRIVAYASAYKPLTLSTETPKPHHLIVIQLRNLERERNDLKLMITRQANHIQKLHDSLDQIKSRPNSSNQTQLQVANHVTAPTSLPKLRREPSFDSILTAYSGPSLF